MPIWGVYFVDVVIQIISCRVGLHLEDSLHHRDGSAVIDRLAPSLEILHMYVQDDIMCGLSRV